jgi:RNA-directed DNA polymerase
VRYADDIVAGFEHESDAVRFLAELRERLEKFALSLHPDKTRLIEFGRFAAENRKKRGLGKPETFNYLESPVGDP